MSFWCLDCLEKVGPKKCGGRGDMVSTVQCQGITKQMYLCLLPLFLHGRGNKRNDNIGGGGWTWSSVF